MIGTAREGIVSMMGLSATEPAFEAVAEEHRDNAGAVSAKSPSPSEVRGGGTETILSFFACLRLARLFVVDVLFNTSIWASPSRGGKYPSIPLVLLCTRTLSRFVKRFFAATPIPAIPKPELDLENAERITLGAWNNSSSCTLAWYRAERQRSEKTS
jgi:hypothetical protein